MNSCAPFVPGVCRFVGWSPAHGRLSHLCAGDPYVGGDSNHGASSRPQVVGEDEAASRAAFIPQPRGRYYYYYYYALIIIHPGRRSDVPLILHLPSSSGSLVSSFFSFFFFFLSFHFSFFLFSFFHLQTSLLGSSCLPVPEAPAPSGSSKRSHRPSARGRSTTRPPPIPSPRSPRRGGTNVRRETSVHIVTFIPFSYVPSFSGIQHNMLYNINFLAFFIFVHSFISLIVPDRLGRLTGCGNGETSDCDGWLRHQSITGSISHTKKTTLPKNKCGIQPSRPQKKKPQRDRPI